MYSNMRITLTITVLLSTLLFQDGRSLIRDHLIHGEQPCFRPLNEVGNVQQFIDQFRQNDTTQSNRGSDNSYQSVAQILLEDLDVSVNPCDNFFQFACGGFINRTSPPSGFNTLLSSRRSEISNIIKQELSRPLQSNDALPFRKAKQLYKSCMDEKVIEDRGILPIKRFLADRGGWPVLGNWQLNRFDLTNSVANTRYLFKDFEFHYQPSGVIIGTIVQRDFTKKDRYAIYVDQPGLGQFSFSNLINHEMYRLGVNNFYNKAYEDYLVDTAVLLGADVTTAKRDMRDVLIFETKLASIMLFEEERRLAEQRYEKISIFELSLRYPYINWLMYFRKVLSIANIQINPNFKVVLWAAPYYDKLGKILAQTSHRTLANYILFRAIQPLLPTANEAIRYVSLRYSATVNGVREPRLTERADFCTGIVSDQMSWVTSRVFLGKSSLGDPIRYVSMINDYVRSVLLEMIKSSAWLTPKTKQFVLNKMSSLTIDIGFPAEVNDDSFLDQYYSTFNFGKSFFENMEESLSQNYKYVLSQLQRAPTNQWILRPGDINALHYIGNGNIEIPYGILASPFFNSTFPVSMNFGGIGFLIGHEYAHGFERTGISFDANGLLGKYWSSPSFINYLQKEKCFIEQYSQYYLPDIKVLVANGGKTINENLCDFLGVRAGFHAYQKFKRQNNVIDRPSDLPFTDNQLFFINYARGWCANASPTFLRKFPFLDHHSLNRLRVIGPLQNSEEFSKAFNCPVGSFMNPPKKCDFW